MNPIKHYSSSYQKQNILTKSIKQGADFGGHFVNFSKDLIFRIHIVLLGSFCKGSSVFVVTDIAYKRPP